MEGGFICFILCNTNVAVLYSVKVIHVLMKTFVVGIDSGPVFDA